MIRRRPHFMRRNRSEEETWYRVKDRLNDVLETIKDLDSDDESITKWTEELTAIRKEVNQKFIKALKESKE